MEKLWHNQSVLPFSGKAEEQVQSAVAGPVSTPSCYTILGIDITVADYAKAFSMIENALNKQQHMKLAFLNAHGANIAASDRLVHTVFDQFTVFPDGCGVDIAAKLLYGSSFTANLNGTDFVPALFHHIKRPLNIGLLGAAQGVAERAAAHMGKNHPHHEFTAINDGYFDMVGQEKILQHLKQARYDVVLVALGNPVQELWISKYCTKGHGTVFMGVGALFDFISEDIPRAPQWMINKRLEWVYRLWIEPKRMWRRYIIGNPLFLLRVLKQKISFWFYNYIQLIKSAA